MGKSLFLVFALFLIFNSALAGFRVRRRRRSPPPCDTTPCTWQWGPCSTSCGPGTETAAITRQKGPCGACSVPSPRSCNPRACPVNCVWDQWNTWESCTVSCGGGTRVRTRSKLVEAAHGGADCAGDTHETQPCGNQCCPVDCKWDSWGNYSACSVSCGNGTMMRSRMKEVTASCGGLECEGSNEEISFCNDECCAVDCEITAWSSWSPCTETCGLSGVSFRERKVKKQAECGGFCPKKLNENIVCNLICLNEGVIDSVNNECMCGKGWSGTCCENEVKCTEDNPEEVCDINAVCLYSACHCLPGFRGDGKICADENECTEGSHDCSDNAKCINSDGAFDCECKDGYEGDGFLCEDKDECELQTAGCHESAACMNNDGGYDCLCFPGFHGNGFNCTQGCTYDELPEIKGEGFYEEEGLFDFFHIGEQANLQCEDGYKATGATTTTCTENGFVNEGNMICVKYCRDKNRQCSRWQKRGYCDQSSHRVFMNHFCQKSCKLC